MMTLDPSVSSDGLELYFAVRIARADMAADDLYVSKRATRNDPWGPPVNLGPAVNSPADEDGPCLSPDGLLLFFSDERSRPGGMAAVTSG